MEKLDRMIAEIKENRLYFRRLFHSGVKGACIDAAACAIRQRALEDAKEALTKG